MFCVLATSFVTCYVSEVAKLRNSQDINVTRWLDLQPSVTGGECILQSLVHRTQVSLGILQKEFGFVAALAY